MPYPAAALTGLAAVAILFALAFPVRHDARHPARISSSLRLAAPVQQSVAVYHYLHDAFPTSNLAADVADPVTPGDAYVRSITITDVPRAGTVRIAFTPGGRLSGESALLLVPTAYGDGLLWECVGTGIPFDLLPPECRPPQRGGNLSAGK